MNLLLTIMMIIVGDQYRVLSSPLPAVLSFAEKPSYHYTWQASQNDNIIIIIALELVVQVVYLSDR